MQCSNADPPLSTLSAHLISLGLSFTYVASIFVTCRGRLAISTNTGARKGTRDDPEIIKSRLINAITATMCCCVAVFAILWKLVGRSCSNSDVSFEAILIRLGFMPPTFAITSALPHFVAPVLYLGPLFASGFLGGELPFMKNFSWKHFCHARIGTIYGLRNYIIAPITEEIVFRSCVIAVYNLSGTSRDCIIFFASLTFGLAHVHHAYEVFHQYGMSIYAAKIAAMSSVFQLMYTYSIGTITSYLFLRTGSILPPITAHIFCNMMGFPDVNSEFKRFPMYKKTIIGAYGIGIVGFVYALTRWTETPNNIYWPSSNKT